MDKIGYVDIGISIKTTREMPIMLIVSSLLHPFPQRYHTSKEHIPYTLHIPKIYHTYIDLIYVAICD